MTREICPVRWALVLVVLVCAQAGAVIKIKLPVSKIQKTSRTVLIGTVTAADTSGKTLDVAIVKTLKGAAPGNRLRIDYRAAKGVGQKPAAKQPVVLFVGARKGGRSAVIHLADTWLLARTADGGDRSTWQVTGPHDGATSFPGRTRALVRILEDMKAGRPGVQDWISHEGFLGGVRKVASLGVTPTFMATADVNGDRRLDLLVCTKEGLRLFLGGASGYTDATRSWGLAGARAARCVVGDADADGRPDLLLGGAIWRNRGKSFIRQPVKLQLPGDSDWSGAALADATGDGRVDAVVLSTTGRLVVAVNPGAGGKPWLGRTPRALWSDGAAALGAAFSQEWGDNGKLHVMVARPDGIFRYAVDGKDGPPADFRRLTGITLDSYKWLGRRPLKVLLTAAFDYEGNRRIDFLVVTVDGGITLANRGYGAFLINRYVHQQMNYRSKLKLPKLPVPLTSGTVAAPGRFRLGRRRRCQDLLVLTRDGTLYEMDSTRR